MELIERLLFGSESLWGGGVAHSVLILALVVALGVMLGKLKVAGVSLGVTGILFVGIAFSYFGMNVDEHLCTFSRSSDCSFRLFERLAGRARFFNSSIPQGRRHAQQTGGAGGGAGCRHDGGALLHHGLVHDDDGRRDVGRRDQHARTGRRTAGFRDMHAGADAPGHRPRVTPWPTRWASWEPSSR